MEKVPANPTATIITALFVGTWIVLGVGTFVASWYLNAQTKRRWMPRLMILVGVLFVIFSTTLMVIESGPSALGVLIVVIPMVALISFLNIKFTKFCDNCNATLYNSNWFVPQKYCTRCGAKLVGSKPLSGDNLFE